MTAIATHLARRARPPTGWVVALFALVAALAPAAAASGATLRLPAGVFWWAGLVGLALGLALAGDDGRRTTGQEALRSVARRPSSVVVLAALAALGAAFVLAALQALPPPGLVYQDVVGLAAWAAPLLGRALPDGPPPAAQSLAFLRLALPRVAGELLAALNAGERGARLLVSAAGVALTWAGSLALGYGLARGRQPLAWGLPLLAALTLTAVLGGAGGGALAVGIGALLLAAAAGAQRARRTRWERTGADYSDEIGRDVLSWGIAVVAAALLAAWAVPLWPGNPIARLFEQQQLPSGLAALQRGIQSPRGDPAQVGVSSLPGVLLGQTLQQGPPEQVALRVRTGAPLPGGAAPRYWRVRLLNVYTGGGWSSDARVSAQPATTIEAELPAGTVAQQVEDLRRDRTLAPGLADLVGVDVPGSAERLEDGSLAALVIAPTDRYRALSRPMELAPLPPPDREPPSMGAYLGLLPGMPPRVRDLAVAVSGGDAGIPAMERALRLEAYLRELPYAYEVQPLPHGGDAVDQFLFEMRQGYCTYYASAMAVMARSIGIPSRVAVGYATGEYDAASGTYTVREADAHAWPELYIGQRWEAFEPTPVRPLPARAAGGSPELQVVEDAAQPEATPDRLRGPLIWAGVLALVALVTAAGVLLGRPRRRPPPVMQAQLAIERFGARAGVRWPAGATLHEYGALLVPHANGAAEALDDAVVLVELARYGGRGLDAEEERRLVAASERLGAAARGSARVPDGR